MPDNQLQLGQDDSFLALQKAWECALEALREQVNKPSYESWVKPAQPLAVEDTVVRIGTNSSFAKRWLENKHIPLITKILEAHLGFTPRVKIELMQPEEPVMMTETLPQKPKPQTKRAEEEISQPLNTRYNFENFVVGPTNRLAYACAAAIAEEPGSKFNPLFLYGGAGLGKTHLMNAVGQMLAVTRPELRVVYVSGETFTFHYINALREHRAAEFRRQYRNVDVWLVDDIQFLAGKERTEEEFFHTYNAIYEMGKQVLLTSDRAPKNLELDTRLLSRFECGMVADIMPPDLETRMAILQSKAETERMILPNEVILYIARLITSNIRQLEGALIKLHAYASLMKTPVTSTLAEEVLGEYFGEVAPAVVDIHKIQEAVAKRFDVPVADLKGKARDKEIVMPRQVAMYLARDITENSLPAIGRAFGGKDHSTVIHACKKIEEKLGKDRPFATLIEELSRQIRDGKSC